MSFGHPWMLLGALAALIPLAVHLFDRRRPRPHPFAAISFVLRSQRRTASRLKLKRLLLYVLRTMVLLCIPLALALPQCRKPGTPAATARGPAATAVILDASFGMRFNDGTLLFEKGREQARAALRALLPEEPATLVICSSEPAVPPAASFDRARLRGLVDEAQPGYGVADMSRCLELGAHALSDSPLPGKRLIVVSAFLASSFRLEVPAPTVAGPDGKPIKPDVVLQDVAAGRKSLPNHALVDVKSEYAPQVGPHAFQFGITVRNYAEQPAKDLAAAFQVNGKTVAKAFLDLSPQGTAQKTLTYRFDQGGTAATALEVTPDALPDDDRREANVLVPRDLRVLVIDGEPSSQRYRDEAFFVDAALTAPGSPVQETSRDPDAAFKEGFSGYDVVALLNVPAPTEDQVKRLRTFVETGGGLLITGGEHVEPDLYNSRFGDLLPRAFRVVKTAVAPNDPDAERRAARFKDIAVDQPLFSPFAGRAREGLMATRFYRYLLMEAGAKGSDATVLATFEDGAPALATVKRGQGRVLVFASTLDRDWTDFPIRTSFLPLVQRFAAFLGGSLEEREAVRSRVGQVTSLRAAPGQRIAGVKGPGGVDVPVRVQAEGAVLAGPLPVPGPYRVLDPQGAVLPELGFAATLDPAASDLTRLKPEELAAYFGEETVKAAGEQRAQPVPLWTWLMVAAALAFFFEGTLLRK